MPVSETVETVGVRCPRCDTRIACTAVTETGPPKPGRNTPTITYTVSDLSERLAAHYREAHPALQTELTAAAQEFNVRAAEAGRRGGREFGTGIAGARPNA